MKKILFIYLTLLFPSVLMAQKIRIDEVWNNIENVNITQQEKLKIGIQQQELNNIRQNRLPLFYVDGNLQRNLVIPITPVPSIAFNPNAPIGEITPLKFATKWSSKIGVQLEWKIFDPTSLGKTDEQKLVVEKAQLSEAQRKHNWKKDAVLAYTSVVLASLQYQNAIEDSTKYAEVLQITKERFNAGRIYSSEYLASQQEAERKKIQLIEAATVLTEASLELRDQVETKEAVQLSSGIKDIVDFIGNQKIYNTYEQQNLTLDEKITQAQLSQIKKQNLPSLTFNTYYGKQFFDNKLQLFKNEQWFGNSYANLAIRIPLSGYLIKSANEKKLSLQANLNKLQLNELVNDDALTQQKRLKKADAATLKIKSYERILNLAQQNELEQFAAYQAGRILISIYNNAVVDVNKAKQNLWQAQYDYIKIILE